MLKTVQNRQVWDIPTMHSGLKYIYVLERYNL